MLFWFTVRVVLGCTVLDGLFCFAGAVEEKFGRQVKQLLLVISATQFHFMFYMSRPLPNIFALSLGKFHCIYSLTCLKESPKERTKSGCLRQVTP